MPEPLFSFATGLAAISSLGVVWLALALALRLVHRTPPGALGSEARCGTFARVALAIPEGGVGTVVVEGRGRFRTLPARSLDGSALAHATRVVVVEIDRGVASVTAYDDGLSQRS